MNNLSRLILIISVLSFSNGYSQIFNKNKSKFQSTDILEVNYVISKYNETKSTYIDTLKTKEYCPGKSALVLIDLWEESFLNPMINEFINPLLKEAQDLGIHVIYAPSQNEQNKNLKIVNDGVVFYDLDLMDAYIQKHEINTLFYVGFDALYCVIDKPNGIFSFKERNSEKNINYFVLDKGVTSYTKEMKTSALALFKKNNIGVVMTPSVDYKNIYPKDTHMDVLYKTTHNTFPGRNFVLIFKNKMSNPDLDSFIEKLQLLNIPYAEVINGKLFFDKKHINETYEFIQLIIELDIDNIYYAGYHLNNEILWSKFGITTLYSKKRYFNIKELPNIFAINDLVYTTQDSDINASIQKAVIINHYRNINNIFSKQLIETKTQNPPLLNNIKGLIKKHLSWRDLKVIIYSSIIWLIIFFTLIILKYLRKRVVTKNIVHLEDSATIEDDIYKET